MSPFIDFLNLVLVVSAFALGYVTCASNTAVTKVKYRFIPRTASEQLAIPDETLREFSKMFSVTPSPSINAAS